MTAKGTKWSVEAAERELDRIIEKRAEARDDANWQARMWRESEEKHRECIRRRNLALWYDHYLRLADSHGELSRDYQAKALSLLEMDSS